MSAGRLWWADVLVTVDLLRYARFDLDGYLLNRAPLDARLPCRIERVHVRPHDREGVILLRCFGREAT